MKRIVNISLETNEDEDFTTVTISGDQIGREDPFILPIFRAGEDAINSIAHRLGRSGEYSEKSQWHVIVRKDGKAMSENIKAPEGQVWVCFACGKTSEWKYGFDNNNKDCVKSRGWDASCMMNSCLAPKDKCTFENGLVTKIDADVKPDTY